MPNWIGLTKRYVYLRHNFRNCPPVVSKIQCSHTDHLQNFFDFIHIRNIAQAIGDWEKLLKQAYK